MDILDDMGVSKLSAKVFLKVNYSFNDQSQYICNKCKIRLIVQFTFTMKIFTQTSLIYLFLLCSTKRILACLFWIKTELQALKWQSTIKIS